MGKLGVDDVIMQVLVSSFYGIITSQAQIYKNRLCLTYA